MHASEKWKVSRSLSFFFLFSRILHFWGKRKTNELERPAVEDGVFVS